MVFFAQPSQSYHLLYHYLLLICLLTRTGTSASFGCNHCPTGQNHTLGQYHPLAARMEEASSACCLRGFQWSGTPIGTETMLGPLRAYVTGPTDSGASLLIIHDLFGWTFPNIRLLADFYAHEVGARVWVPDLYVTVSERHGASIPAI